MRSVLALPLLLLAHIAYGADLSIAGPDKIGQHKIIELVARDADKDAALIWDVYPEDQADIREIGGKLYFTAPPGVYKIKLRAVKPPAVATARLTVTVEGPAPPQPMPPNPVPPPQPTDPLTLAIRAAYGADLSATKDNDRKMLAAVYRALAAEGKGINDAGITTSGQVADVIIAARAAAVAERLPTVRELVGEELGKVLPVDRNAVLTAGQKQATGAVLIRAAGILEGLSG